MAMLGDGKPTKRVSSRRNKMDQGVFAFDTVEATEASPTARRVRSPLDEPEGEASVDMPGRWLPPIRPCE